MSKTIKTSKKGDHQKPLAPSAPAPTPPQTQINPNFHPTIATTANRRSAVTMVIILGVVLMVSAGLQFLTGINSKFIEPTDMASGEPDPYEVRFGIGGLDLDGDKTLDKDYYRVPNISSTEKNFCTGIIKTDSCTERPISPYYEALRLYDMPIPEKEKQRKYMDKQTKKRFWFFD